MEAFSTLIVSSASPCSIVIVCAKRDFLDTGLLAIGARSVFLSRCCSQLARLVARLTVVEKEENSQTKF